MYRRSLFKGELSMEEQNKFSSRIDFSLVTILLLLCVGRRLAIYSAQTTGQYAENFLIKQIFGI